MYKHKHRHKNKQTRCVYLSSSLSILISFVLPNSISNNNTSQLSFKSEFSITKINENKYVHEPVYKYFRFRETTHKKKFRSAFSRMLQGVKGHVLRKNENHLGRVCALLPSSLSLSLLSFPLHLPPPPSVSSVFPPPLSPSPLDPLASFFSFLPLTLLLPLFLPTLNPFSTFLFPFPFLLSPLPFFPLLLSHTLPTPYLSPSSPPFPSPSHKCREFHTNSPRLECLINRSLEHLSATCACEQ